ncbi:MAG: hypothetical protein R3360_04405, partial [Alphaproteobacteria bacterium]|nr:hypothetical protein [Alphaproteobacteria bacterium]
IDSSVLTPPPVPEGTSDGEKASFEDGTYNHRQSADAVAQTNSVMGLAQALAPAFESTPRVPASAGAFVGWAVQEAVGHYAGVAMDNHVSNALETMKHINQQFAAEPTTSNVANYASKPAKFGETTYSGIDVDYLTDTVLDICNTTEMPEIEEGYAAGHFSWSNGTIQLVGRGAVKGMPAAQSIAPVTPPGGMSIGDALAMARAMGAQNVPDVADIEAQLPQGYSLTKTPIHMTGRAGSGPTIAPNLQEWMISYFVELKPEGEKIGEVWIDPRR